MLNFLILVRNFIIVAILAILGIQIGDEDKRTDPSESVANIAMNLLN